MKPLFALSLAFTLFLPFGLPTGTSEPVMEEQTFVFTPMLTVFDHNTFQSKPCDGGAESVVKVQGPASGYGPMTFQATASTGNNSLDVSGEGIVDGDRTGEGNWMTLAHGLIELADCGEVGFEPFEGGIEYDCDDDFVSVIFESLTKTVYLWGRGVCTRGPISNVPTVETLEPSGPGQVVSTVRATQANLVGCVGTVQVDFVGGASLPMPGVRMGNTPCAPDTPPCDPYLGQPGIVACSANSLACCTPLYDHELVRSEDIVCIRTTITRVDLNNDGLWDVVLPSIAATPGACA